MTSKQIETLCKEKGQELLNKYFGNLVNEATIVRPETIDGYTKDLPLKIESEYRTFLERLWKKYAPDGLKDTPLVLEEQKLRKLMTDDDREGYRGGLQRCNDNNFWEKITKSNHEDVTYYKGLLEEHAKDLLLVMREDFLEEITGEHIGCKAFKE